MIHQNKHFQKIKIPSNRNFGIVFFIFFLIIAFWPLLNANDIRIWSLIISIIFLILGILNSNFLTPLNKIWMKIGVLLGNIVSPIIMGIIYFGVVFPTGFLMKIFGKDILRLKKNNDQTYWISKDNSNNNMRNQF
ncbi:SxtJ family membrane protein [Candidatus Pelagibacter sp.]|nr:SxtJ family membrane protein [Candidatus Pelagibacter sp.]